MYLQSRQSWWWNRAFSSQSGTWTELPDGGRSSWAQGRQRTGMKGRWLRRTTPLLESCGLSAWHWWGEENERGYSSWQSTTNNRRHWCKIHSIHKYNIIILRLKIIFKLQCTDFTEQLMSWCCILLQTYCSSEVLARCSNKVVERENSCYKAIILLLQSYSISSSNKPAGGGGFSPIRLRPISKWPPSKNVKGSL